MGQGIQVTNSKTAEANSQETAEGLQFADLQLKLSPIPENLGVKSNGVAPDSNHFEVNSEDHSQDLPLLLEPKASSHSCKCGMGCRLSKAAVLCFFEALCY